MHCYVKWEDDGITPCDTYYKLKTYPGLNTTDWEPIGQGAPITVNNPKVYANLAARNYATMTPLIGGVDGYLQTFPTLDLIVGAPNTFGTINDGDRIWISNTGKGYTVATSDNSTNLTIEEPGIGSAFTNATAYKLIASVRCSASEKLPGYCFPVLHALTNNGRASEVFCTWSRFSGFALAGRKVPPIW
jgi:hypothetical protein